MNFAYLKSLLSTTEEGVVFLDSGLRVISVSDAFTEFFAKNNKQVIGKSYLALVKELHPDKALLQRIDQFFSSQAEQASFRGKMAGSELHIEKISDEDQQVGWLVIYFMRGDVLEYLNNIASFMPGYFYWKDKEGHYLGCNQAVLDMLRFSSKSELVGKTDYDLWPDQAIKLRGHDMSVMGSGSSIRLEEEVHIEGRSRYYTVVKTALRDRNRRIIGIIGNSFDVTEKVELQQSLARANEVAQVASKAKTEFIANISHDMRTPLTGIIGMAEAISLTDALPEEVQDYAVQLTKASYRLLNLLNNVLELPKLEQGGYSGEVRVFALQKLVVSVKELLSPSIFQRKLDSHYACDEAIPKFLVGNESLLNRVLLNLMSNAIKFTDAGSVGLSVRLVEKRSKQVSLEFIVKDTGIGVPKDKQNSIFEPFSRLTASYKGRYEGAGLGLHIVKQFVGKMGGDVVVDSAEGVGSEFLLRIPFRVASVAQIASFLSDSRLTGRKKLINKKEARGGKILLIEDDKIAGTVAKLTLERLHDTVDIVTNGESALEALKSTQYDLAYIDIGLPDISGDQVVKQYREWERKECIASLPLVALTAHVDEEKKREWLSFGLDCVIRKPLSFEEAKDVAITYIVSQSVRIKEHVNKGDDGEIVSNKVIDLEYGKTLVGNDKVVAEQVLSAFAESLVSEKEQLEQLYQNSEREALTKAVHKLRGGASYVGVPRLKAALKTLEIRLASGEKRIDIEYQKVQEEIVAVLLAVEGQPG